MNVMEFNDLTEEIQQLVLSALDARNLAYAPYSNFHVGVSILTEDGDMLQGANQENASYPLCLCAERVALSYAAMNRPNKEYIAMAISTSANLSEREIPAPPCGACRQVIMEYQQRQKKDMKIYLVGNDKRVWIYDHISTLLPHSFQGDFLKK